MIIVTMYHTWTNQVYLIDFRTECLYILQNYNNNSDTKKLNIIYYCYVSLMKRSDIQVVVNCL